jgi:hypothetical protein
MVDINDLWMLSSHWQQSSFWTGGDFDYNGFVDAADLGMLARNWQVGVGNPLGSATFGQNLNLLGLPGITVPEPLDASLWCLLVALASRRRHTPRTGPTSVFFDSKWA